MSNSTFIITIDGPSASGKSSVSRELAARQNWKWVSTGAFYRGLAYVAKAKGLGLSDESRLSDLATSQEWEVRMMPERTEVWMGNENVTDFIYREDVGAIASQISQIPSVRRSLLQAQRDCARGLKGLVAEGRDCGTVVFPAAQVKIYLTAHSDSRAERRAREAGMSLAETKAAQSVRDRQDSTRKSAPLAIPDKAIVVDTSEMDLAAVVDHVHQIVTQRMNK